MNANIYKNRNDFFNFNPLVSNALKPIKAKTKILKHSLKRKKSFFFIPFIKIRKDKQRNKKEIVKNKSDIVETSNTNRILYKNIITKRNNSISDHLSKNYNNINRYMNVKNEKEKIIFVLLIVQKGIQEAELFHKIIFLPKIIVIIQQIV